MPNTKVAPVPLFAEDRNELLRVLQAADEPLEAAKVAKLAMTARRAKPGEITAILEEFIATGALQAFPASTAKGKTRYWDRDPKTVARAAILDLVQYLPEPISAKELKKLVRLPFPFSEAEIAAVLSDLAQRGAICEIPAKTAKSGLRYWQHDALEFGRQNLLAQLQLKGPQPKSKLKRLVKWLDEARLEQVIEKLVKSRELYCHPAIGTSGPVLFSHRPPAPEPYLKDVGERLSKAVEKLRHADVRPADIRRAVVQIMESAGLTFGAGSPTKEEVSQDQTSETVDLISLMKRIEPAADRGALVTAQALRQAAKLSKTEFDALALQLARQGKISLHEHDFAASLTPADRDGLITDGQGHYYVGLALRTGSGDA